VLLYDGLNNTRPQAKSFFAVGLKAAFTDGWPNDHVPAIQSGDWSNSYFGYFGYEYKNRLEQGFLPLKPSSIALPETWFGRFSTVFVFHHQEKKLIRYGEDIPPLPAICSNNEPEVSTLQSNFSRQDYLQTVSDTIEQIHAGEFYQANITRKFHGTLSAAPDYFEYFRTLCSLNPARYSAWLKIKGTHILSSSPECFLTVEENGSIITQPIKGTIHRGETEQEDTKLKNQLQNSEKDRAENLMIVDLMRNDLSHSSEAGSVSIDNLFAITTHRNLHHLNSTIRAQKKPDTSLQSVVESCFPPGSMTGAPKISALHWCDKAEKYQRGIYSGALGWIHPNGSCDLSVVIRTLLLSGNQFEFQVGGGIVADSHPETEWQETLTKAKAILGLLQIPLSQAATL
jgi:anthranilate/para-aminobenzoate synthase component I